MKECKALLNIAAHTVQLYSTTHGIVVLQLPSPTATTLTLHHTTTQNLEGIRFLMYFPKTCQAYLRIGM
jgi:hypothetical protein